MTPMQIELSDPRTQLYPLTVDQYHEMIAQGIVAEGEPYELIEGTIVRKDRSALGQNIMTVGHDHSWAVTALEELNPRLRRLGCFMRIQQPVSLPPLDEPEPDGAIVLGRKDDYADRHPTHADILCVIEVADASLRRDQTTKAERYALGGVQLYLIINLQARTIEVYSNPKKGRYASPQILSASAKMSLPAPNGKSLTVPVNQLIPPRRDDPSPAKPQRKNSPRGKPNRNGH